MLETFPNDIFIYVCMFLLRAFFNINRLLWSRRFFFFDTLKGTLYTHTHAGVCYTTCCLFYEIARILRGDCTHVIAQHIVSPRPKAKRNLKFFKKVQQLQRI